MQCQLISAGIEPKRGCEGSLWAGEVCEHTWARTEPRAGGTPWIQPAKAPSPRQSEGAVAVLAASPRQQRELHIIHSKCPRSVWNPKPSPAWKRLHRTLWMKQTISRVVRRRSSCGGPTVGPSEGLPACSVGCSGI